MGKGGSGIEKGRMLQCRKTPGTAEDTPEHLTALLNPDQHVRSQALDHLHYAVHHQTTLYTATIPAALYVAGILPDSRTAWPVDLPGPMRAALLGWLGSVADQADDEAAGRKPGAPGPSAPTPRRSNRVRARHPLPQPGRTPSRTRPARRRPRDVP